MGFEERPDKDEPDLWTTAGLRVLRAGYCLRTYFFLEIAKSQEAPRRSSANLVA